MTYRFKQCWYSIVVKYFSQQSPNYLNEIFDVATESNFLLKNTSQKSICAFRKTNRSQFALSCIGPNFWNKTLGTLKRQKQPSRGVLRKSCSEDMQQIYRRTTMPKCDFHKDAKKLYWINLLNYFQNIFLYKHLWRIASETN